MDIGTLLSVVSSLEKAHPIVKSVVDSLMASIASDPGTMQEISTAISKIAELKSVSVTELIQNGGLARAMLEKISSGGILKEETVAELQSMTCDGCGKTHYQLVESVRTSPIAAVAQVLAATT